MRSYNFDYFVKLKERKIRQVIAGISGWFLFSVKYRQVQTENSFREKYEKIARKKRKRLVIIYNPVGQQFYPRQEYQSQTQTQRSPSTGYQPVDTKVAYCPKCGSKVEQGYQFFMNCSAKLS